jgi:putative ATP-dependent endonuclease of OLD family
MEDRVQALWWSPKMLEALTARFVIVVEGLADRLVVEAAARVLDVPLDRIGAVVLELGGSENFKSVYKLLGPAGFGVEILGLVDDAEKGPWLGAVGGKPVHVVGRTVFVSTADLEEEYCKAVDTEALGARLIASKVARDETALLSACNVGSAQQLTAQHLATYCRSNAGSGKGSRKVPSALAVAKSLTRSEAEKIASVFDLLSVLRSLAGI